LKNSSYWLKTSGGGAGKKRKKLSLALMGGREGGISYLLGEQKEGALLLGWGHGKSLRGGGT